METIEKQDHTKCKTQMVLPVRDALDVLGGKWKIAILGALFFGNKRFSELKRDLEGITDRMLAKELRSLEMNHLLSRTELNTFPATVEYALTDYGHSVQKVIEALRDWGLKHREKVVDEFWKG
ncbi:transcriptional regulator [bacterium]|nr:transcriptional regulator [bacterium]